MPAVIMHSIGNTLSFRVSDILKLANPNIANITVDTKDKGYKSCGSGTLKIKK